MCVKLELALEILAVIELLTLTLDADKDTEDALGIVVRATDPIESGELDVYCFGK